VQKSTLKRANSSPFATAKRKKPNVSNATPNIKRTRSAPEADEAFDLRLDDEGLLASLANDLTFSDVVQQIKYVSARQWAAIPDTAAGMNSTRIAEILNLRRRMPPLVSVHHVHALSKYPTSTEREIGMLVNKGIIRRVALPARELGGSSPGEALVLVEDWEQCITQRKDINEDAKGKYVKLLKDPGADVELTQEQVAVLVHAGFLTGASLLNSHAQTYLRPGESLLGNLNFVSKAGIQHYSGSADAVATSSQHHISGGSGFSRRISTPPSSTPLGKQHILTLPNIGEYLKLLYESRAHLLGLLSKSNRYRELPASLLNERWDGGVAGNDEATRAQRLRGQWVGVVPGKTKKWRSFHGLEFQWVLEECLGAGLVECFRTGSVGMGVRAI
jgi:hypothetical protein